MIPTFPSFKEIEIADKAPIEEYTKQYRPYSDFNFTNLWCWNTKGKHEISLLNGNLVVIFSDYLTEEPCISFLGNKALKATVTELIAFAQKSNISPRLRYIPEESFEALRREGFAIEEDEENFDYIFSVEELARLEGPILKTKRQSSHKFERENPAARFSVEDIKDYAIQVQLISVFETWRENRISDTRYDMALESKAFHRLLDTVEDHDLLLSCIYLENVMIGFSIDEILPQGYAISHFLKADVSFKGIYEFFNEKVAGYLLTKGVTLWNWEQDLNIEGLRRLKKSYHPISYLKKYRVGTKRMSLDWKSVWPFNLLTVSKLSKS